MQTITPFLWFDTQAGEAAKFYTSVFKNGKIKHTNVMSDTPSGTVEIYTIEILGQEFQLMSAGPLFKFNESISFVVNCDTQEEVDYYWEKLSGVKESEQCGWCKDRFGVSWQIVPRGMDDMMNGKDPEASKRAMQAMLQMKKLDIKKLQDAYNGK